MLNRLEGAVMIINTLMPLVLVLGLFLIGWALVHQVKQAAAGPLARVQSGIERMGDTVTEAKAAAGVVTHTVIDGVARPIQAAAKSVETIPDSISLEVPDIRIPTARLPIKPHIELVPTPRVWTTDVTVEMPTIKGFAMPQTPIPGLVQTKRLLADSFDIFARFVDVLRQIASIGSLGENVTEVLAATRDLWDRIRDATATTLAVAKALIYFAVFWFLLSYTLWARRRLRIGWALLRGRGALPETSGSDHGFR